MDLAARLLVRAFKPHVRTVQRRPLDLSTGIQADLMAMAGVPYRIAIRHQRAEFNEAFLQLALECVLLWESEHLAARLAAGTDPRTDVILLRKGQQLLDLERPALLANSPA